MSPSELDRKHPQSSGTFRLPRRWVEAFSSHTDSSLLDQGEVGINATILFEALAGGRAVSHLELTNVGNTSVSYSWQRLRPQQSFPHLHIQTNRPHFYFNSSSGRDAHMPGENGNLTNNTCLISGENLPFCAIKGPLHLR